MVNGIEITDVIIFPVKKQEKDAILKAYCRIVLNDQFIISGVKIMNDKLGCFIRYPQEFSKEGKSFNICFPITAKLRTYITNQVLEQYSIVKQGV